MLNELTETVQQTGHVTWIGISSAPHSDIQPVESVEALVGHGLAGDHHSKKKPDKKRQVTLIQEEHFPIIAKWANQPEVRPEQCRRNIVVSGINLIALKTLKFRIGNVILEGSGSCAPCSRMEETIGEGGFQAMRGHGGITAKVLVGGEIKVGAAVEVYQEATS